MDSEQSRAIDDCFEIDVPVRNSVYGADVQLEMQVRYLAAGARRMEELTVLIEAGGGWHNNAARKPVLLVCRDCKQEFRAPPNRLSCNSCKKERVRIHSRTYAAKKKAKKRRINGL